MPKLQIITDIARAETLWRANIPADTLFDLWEVRQAFHRHFKRPLRFLVGSSSCGRKLFLALSWVEEKKAWCFFPGETWSNKTWLEQNRLNCYGYDRERLAEELGAAFHLRYIAQPQAAPIVSAVDEIGYLFYPPDYLYNPDNWQALFGHKHSKNVRRELDALERQGAHIRYGGLEDFDLMVEMNEARFNDRSYFADPRFREGFRDMLAALAGMALLRTTMIEIGGVTAAVDFGSVYRGRYTLLAGGTDARFPTVAKMINLHHVKWACSAKLSEIDFLCGDFSWKPLFHLTPRPLYLFSSMGFKATQSAPLPAKADIEQT